MVKADAHTENVWKHHKAHLSAARGAGEVLSAVANQRATLARTSIVGHSICVFFWKPAAKTQHHDMQISHTSVALYSCQGSRKNFTFNKACERFMAFAQLLQRRSTCTEIMANDRNGDGLFFYNSWKTVFSTTPERQSWKRGVSLTVGACLGGHFPLSEHVKSLGVAPWLSNDNLPMCSKGTASGPK